MLNGKFEEGDKVITTQAVDLLTTYYEKGERGVVDRVYADDYYLVSFYDNTESLIHIDHLALDL